MGYRAAGTITRFLSESNYPATKQTNPWKDEKQDYVEKSIMFLSHCFDSAEIRTIT